MPIRAITFDCAQTIMKVDWRPAEFAIEVARAIGVTVPDDGAQVFNRLHLERMPQFLTVNLRRSPSEGGAFYERLNRDWLVAIGGDPMLARKMTAEADLLAFGESSRLFQLFSDTFEAFEELRRRGYLLAVISNWDYTLHRVLAMFGLDRFLKVSVASLEEGVEKPDPRLFKIALAKIGCEPWEAIHVGDDPVDDLQGARASGMKAVLIDRSSPSDLPYKMSSLLQIQEAIACLG